MYRWRAELCLPAGPLASPSPSGLRGAPSAVTASAGRAGRAAEPHPPIRPPAAGWERFPRSRASWWLPFLPVLTEASSGGASVSVHARRVCVILVEVHLTRGGFSRAEGSVGPPGQGQIFFFRGVTSTLPTHPSPMQLGFAKPLPQVVEAKNLLLIFLSLWEVWA